MVDCGVVFTRFTKTRPDLYEITATTAEEEGEGEGEVDSQGGDAGEGGEATQRTGEGGTSTSKSLSLMRRRGGPSRWRFSKTPTEKLFNDVDFSGEQGEAQKEEDERERVTF